MVEATHRLARSAEDALLTRIHGDLHLGQTLIANGDVYIIDFEGEPARPVAERRAKTSALRDVAGIIRSLDYATAVVRRQRRASHALLAEKLSDAFLDTFQQRANEAFAAGYREVVGDAHGSTSDDLLLLFLIEKAAYEVCYEAANRPGWIDVPLCGLAQLAERVLHPNAADR